MDIKLDNSKYSVKITEIENGNISYINGYTLSHDKNFGNRGVIKTFSEDFEG